MLRIESLYVYPVKSCHGIKVSHSDFTERGLRWDREWMFVDAEGAMITQRTHRQLSRIHTHLGEHALTLSAQGHETLTIPYIYDAQSCARHNVTVWEDNCCAYDQGHEAAQWLQRVCGIAGRLLRFDTTHIRPVVLPESYAADTDCLPTAVTAFSDGYPLLILSQASLDDLNTRLKEAVPMERFRPNIVVSGCVAYAEDGWQRIMVGGTRCDIVKPCQRCVFVTVNQHTEATSPEPLRTLAGYRTGVHFGMNAIHRGYDRIHQGDDIQILA